MLLHSACSPLFKNRYKPEEEIKVLRDFISYVSNLPNVFLYNRNNHLLLTYTAGFCSAVAKNQPDPVSLNPTTPEYLSEAGN